MLRYLLPILLWTASGIAQASSDPTMEVLSLPQCAQTCLFGAAVSSPCGLTDSACICADGALQASITACVLDSCTTRHALTTKNITSRICHLPVRDRSESVRISNLAIASTADVVALIRLTYNFLTPKMTLGWDDYTVLISIVIGAPSVAIIDRKLIPHGLGKDVWTVPFDSIITSTKWLYILEVLYFFQIMFVKLTLLFFFLRIFQKPVTQRLLKATIAFDLLWGTAFIFAAIFQCQPIRYFWNMWDSSWTASHPGKCMDVNALAWSNAAISLALDFWMLAIPLYEVFHLHLSLHKKLSISVMFCFGTFVTVISILRLKSLIFFAKSKNPTWDQFDVVQWSNAEIDVAIICACLPALRAMVLRFFPGLTTSSSSRNASLPSAAAAPQSGGSKRSAAHIKTPDVTTLVQTRDVERDLDEISLVKVESWRREKCGSLSSY